MTFIPVKSDWTSKPPVGTPLRSDGHWSVQGLVGAWLFNDGSPNIFDYSYLHQTTNQVVGTIVQTPNGLDFGDGTGNILINRYLSGTPLTYCSTTGGPLTISAMVKPSGQGFNRNIICMGEVTDSNYTISMGINSSNVLAFGNNGAMLNSISSLVVSAGDTHFISFSIINSAILRFFVDGITEVKNDSIGSYVTTGGMSIGRPYLNSGPMVNQNYCGEINLLIIHNRALNDDELESLYSNPYQIFEPQVTWKEIASTTLAQYGFRFISDDGSESEATFAADLNTNVSLAADTITRLRMQIDATGDPDGKQFQLEYRHKPSGGSFGPWGKVS